MKKHCISIIPLLLLGATLMGSLGVSANVIGFDFGQNFFKITLVKPGQPFTIVENIASGRKTHSFVTVTEDIRLFGADSFMESSKYPTTTFQNLHQRLGESFDEEFISKLKQEKYIYNEIVADERGLVGWKISRKA